MGDIKDQLQDMEDRGLDPFNEQPENFERDRIQIATDSYVDNTKDPDIIIVVGKFTITARLLRSGDVIDIKHEMDHKAYRIMDFNWLEDLDDLINGLQSLRQEIDKAKQHNNDRRKTDHE